MLPGVARSLLEIYHNHILFSFSRSVILRLISVTLIGAVLTLPSVIVLIVLDRLRNKGIVKHDLRLSLTYITLALICLAASSIIFILMFLLTSTATVAADKYPYSIFQELFGTLTPIIMAVLVFCVPFKIILNLLFAKRGIKERVRILDIAEECLSPI